MTLNRLTSFRRTGLRARLLAAALLAGLAGAASAGTATVGFVNPDAFRDATPSRPFGGEREREAVRADIEHHLQQLASRHLPADQQLRVDVLDLDLAGDFEPWRTRGQDLRIVRDIAWPRMTVRYTLQRGDQVIDTRTEERIADMGFLSGPNRYGTNDRLRYEKAMLDRWFEARFGRAGDAAR